MNKLRLSTLLFLMAPSLAGLCQNAPDFTVTDSDGNTHTLYADYLDHGKTVLIKIFFTTCPPCNAIAPYMQPLYEDWGAGNYDVEFFELSDKDFDTDALVNSYQANHGQTFPGVGVEGGSLEAVEPYKQGMFGPFYGTPTFVVIAPDGSVQYDVDGFNISETIANLDAAIEATGAERPACSVTEPVNAFLCPGDSVLINGTWYFEAGVYQDLIENEECDTLLWITIGELPYQTRTIVTAFCAGDSVLINGTWYDTPGVFLDTAEAVGGGCDTALTISLTEQPLNTKSVSRTIEEGDSVFVYGQWYHLAGVYTLISESVSGGCDTVVTLTITEISGNDPDIRVKGHVRTYHNSAGIAGAVVQVWLDSVEVIRDTTDATGEYTITLDSTFVVDHDLEVRVEKRSNPGNGVSVLDIVALQKHLLGIELLNTNDKLLAADLNFSHNLTALDVVELRRFILGLSGGFPTADSRSWLFFHEAVTFGLPGLQPPVILDTDPVLLRNIHAGTQSPDFRGIKLGDLNSSVNPQD